jgi:hypothetical protein
MCPRLQSALPSPTTHCLFTTGSKSQFGGLHERLDKTEIKTLFRYVEASGHVLSYVAGAMALPSNFSFAFNNEKFSDRVLVLSPPDAKAPVKKHGKKRKAESLDEEESVFKKLKISSVVLAAQSEFFQALFSGEMKDSKENEVQLAVRFRFFESS